MARETAADVADALRAAAQPFVDDAVSGVSFMLPAVLLVPVGIVIVAVGFVAMALVYGALGSPTGILASVITIAGLLGILAALFFGFRALYRPLVSSPTSRAPRASSRIGPRGRSPIV